MTQEQHQDPIEEAGGYGTPTAEQEMPGDGQQAAQPRGDAAPDAAGDQDSAGEPGAGRLGGTDDQSGAEDAIAEPGFDGVDNREADVAVPSAEAEMDEFNTEDPDAG